MRAAGCVINDYADRDFDPHVERTKLRPIASGKVTPKEALAVFVVLCLSAFGLVLLLNPFTIMLSLPVLLRSVDHFFFIHFYNST
jgi:4-hydroxybenzoate polyprenyltransferase